MIREKFEGKLSYGWINVMAGFLIMATAWGIIYNCASLFIDPISSDLNFTRSQINATMTIRSATQLIISLFAGKIFSKFKIKRLMIVASLTLFGSYFAMSLVSSLPLIYLLTLITSISVTLLCVLPLAIIITNWFQDKSGLPMGIAFMGSGIGGMIFNPLIGKWLVSYGWRTTYQILALVLLAVVLPCTLFAIRVRPRKIGPSASMTDGEIGTSSKETPELSQAFRTVEFWVICLCSVAINMTANTLVGSPAPHFSNIGFPITFSANIISIFMGSLAVGKIILGKVFDLLSLKNAISFSAIVATLGIVGLVTAKTYITLPLFVIFGGIGTAYSTIANPLVAKKAFPQYDYGSIYGVLSAVGALGSVSSPILVGITFDLTQSYFLSFYINIILLVISLVVFQIGFKNK